MSTKKIVNNNIEDVYPLTPLQEGMLFHSLMDQGSTAYVIQFSYDVKIKLDVEYIEQALELLSQRFSALRTSFFYKKLDKPRQVVLKRRKPEFTAYDWSDKDRDEAFEDYSKLLNDDVARGFDLQKDTLLRASYIELRDSSKLVLSMHHIIMDGWCTQKIFSNFWEYYSELSEGRNFDIMVELVEQERNSKLDYNEYIKWLSKQDKKAALKYWSGLLSDYDSSTDLLPIKKPEDNDEQISKVFFELNEKSTEKLRKLASKCGCTINVISETAVGLMLQQYNRTNDAVFGKVVSGRNADIADIEEMIGLFINTVPVRVKYEKDTTVSELLKKQQDQFTENSNYDFCSLADVQSLSDQGSELIKVLFVFENYNSGSESDEGSGEESCEA